VACTAIAVAISISLFPEDFLDRSPGAFFPAAAGSVKRFSGENLIAISCANSKFREERGW
jgi:hypothetical protein